MFAGLKDYWSKQIRPRQKELAREGVVWLAASSGLLVGLTLAFLKPFQDRVINILLGFLTYDAIVLGFCLTASIFALSIPDVALKTKMATTIDPKDGRDPYTDLVFMFTWASLMQLISAMLTLGLLGALGFASNVEFLNSACVWATLGGLYTAVVVYGATQFLAALVTVSQVGEVIIADLR